MNEMFKPNLDPYEMLIILDQRLQNLENAHNRMATAFEQTQADMGVLLASHQHLQMSHAALIDLVDLIAPDYLAQKVANKNKGVNIV